MARHAKRIAACHATRYDIFIRSVAGLTVDQLQMRDGRWVILDLIGKGRRLRTVPVPSWSKQLLDARLVHSGSPHQTEKIVRQVRKFQGAVSNGISGCVRKRGGSKRVPDYQLPEKGALMKFYEVAWAQGVYGKALTYDFFRSV